MDKKGILYIGASPKASVFKLDPSLGNAKAELFFETEDVYVWSMAFDGAGNLFVATGEKGNIYKVDKSGSASLFYESGDDHVRKLMFDAQGNLIAATANKGLVVRIDKNGKGFVLYDSPLVEITALTMDKESNIYAAAAGDSPLPQTARRPTQVEGDSGDGDESGGEALEVTIQPVAGRSAQRAARQSSALYRIETDGVVRTYWENESDRIYALLAHGQGGTVLMGSGENGRLYEISSDGGHTLITQLDELQITELGMDAGNRFYFGTSNSARVYRSTDGKSTAGEYLSEVFDADVSAQWGMINWATKADRPGNITLQSRSGNTSNPDQSWSDWSSPYTEANGQAIQSPSARFFQFRLSIPAGRPETSPVVQEVAFSFLQKNIAPEVQEVTIHPPGEYYPDFTNYLASNSRVDDEGDGGQNGFQTPSFGRKSRRAGYRAISWRTSDDNGDKLRYTIYYRGEKEKGWKVLAKDFGGPVYCWDSQLMPDGRYLAKVVARDDLSNPPSMALSKERESAYFVIDNTGPFVQAVQTKNEGGKTKIMFTVSDAWSAVSRVEYGINASEWSLTYPVDGICDSKREMFEIVIDSAVKGTNSIVIKANDDVGNIGFGTANFEM
jgi:YD repeat-containing protein